MRNQSITPIPCEYCGALFRPYPACPTRPAQRFCTALCGRRSRVQPLATRIAASVTQTDQCWWWISKQQHNGYGKLWYNGRTLVATHAAWFLASGEWPPAGKVIGHTCDHPACMRNDGPLGTYTVRGVGYPCYGHLYLTTNTGNTADMDAKGRRACGDRNGARLYPERVARGEQITRARWTDAQVQAIRRALDDGVTQVALARELGTCQSAISRIKLRKTWRHVN